ncbi:putative allantoin catabolism protein [SAR116 cluster alpha proteobacterium HIMB100]|nr:putative allantoin catabolism protein [SAR116 cluster alpha proteobacterium HIMB100]
MTSSPYYAAPGGLPAQTQLLTDRAVFTDAYAFLPKGTMSDITTSYLPFWEQTRLWVLARPLTGFSETFSHYLMDVGAGGGSTQPDTDKTAQSVLFIVSGQLQLRIDGQLHQLGTGGYAYIPAGMSWAVHNAADEPSQFHWIRKRYQGVDGLDSPDPFVTSDQQTEAVPMPGTNGVWATSRFVDPSDLRHDMHVNIVTFQPGGVIPFAETHVMEHGLYVLQGKAVYHLNQNWVEVEAGDYMWLRAFCPQACYAGGPGPFRYLLYKDVNRHARLDF